MMVLQSFGVVGIHIGRDKTGRWGSSSNTTDFRVLPVAGCSLVFRRDRKLHRHVLLFCSCNRLFYRSFVY
jgi:hypothetical protein